MILQRDYSLPVIEIRVLDTAGMPDAAIRLILNAEGHREILDSRTVPLDAFGLGDDAEPDLAVPAELCAWIGHWSDQHVDPHDALWLSLVNPYGELGTIPWERDVQPAIANVAAAPARASCLRRPGHCGHPDERRCRTAPMEPGRHHRRIPVRAA